MNIVLTFIFKLWVAKTRITLFPTSKQNKIKRAWECSQICNISKINEYMSVKFVKSNHEKLKIHKLLILTQKRMRPSQGILNRRYEFREQRIQVICCNLNSHQKASVNLQTR